MMPTVLFMSVRKSILPSPVWYPLPSAIMSIHIKSRIKWLQALYWTETSRWKLTALMWAKVHQLKSNMMQIKKAFSLKSWFASMMSEKILSLLTAPLSTKMQLNATKKPIQLRWSTAMTPITLRHMAMPATRQICTHSMWKLISTPQIILPKSSLAPNSISKIHQVNTTSVMKQQRMLRGCSTKRKLQCFHPIQMAYWLSQA